MPISYSIDQTQGLIFETWAGEITAADLENHWRGYLDDPEVMEIRTTLVDLRQGKIKFKTENLDRLVQQVVLPRIGNQKWKSALLVGGPVQFGVSRQYQVFAGFYSKDAIFEDRDVALTWLLDNAAM